MHLFRFILHIKVLIKYIEAFDCKVRKCEQVQSVRTLNARHYTLEDFWCVANSYSRTKNPRLSKISPLVLRVRTVFNFAETKPKVKYSTAEVY